MKTLGALAVIWTLYSMYRVFIVKDIGYDIFSSKSNFYLLGACFGLIGTIVGIVYLIITYLP